MNIMLVDGSGHQPDIVVFAETTDHVSRIVTYCASKRIPVVPFGTGTGLEGTSDGLDGRSVSDVFFFHRWRYGS